MQNSRTYRREPTDFDSPGERHRSEAEHRERTRAAKRAKAERQHQERLRSKIEAAREEMSNDE